MNNIFSYSLKYMQKVERLEFFALLVVGSWFCFLYCSQDQQLNPIKVNEYGDIVNNEKLMKNGITTERIMIYPKLSSHSEQYIVRSGILTLSPSAKATVVICHGFMCDKYDAGLIRLLFPPELFNYFVFDFRGHGELHDGQSCTLGKNEKYEVIAAARFLRGHPALKHQQLFVYGFSMGAVAAIEAQAKDGNLFDAMILDCPFESSENLLKRSLENVKFSLFGYEFSLPGRCLLQRYAFHPYIQSLVKAVLKAVAHFDSKSVDVQAYPITPVESVKKINVPCFYISCKNDEKVSVDAIKSMYNNTGSLFKLLWVTNGRRHFDSFFYNPERYRDLIRKFALCCVSGTAKKMCKAETMQDPDENYCGLMSGLDFVTTTGNAIKSAGNP